MRGSEACLSMVSSYSPPPPFFLRQELSSLDSTIAAEFGQAVVDLKLEVK